MNLLLIVALLMPPVHAPMTGLVTYYGRGIMQDVYRYRVRVGDVKPCPECVDFVALLEPGHIGEKVWLEHPDGRVAGPLLVIDCAARRHVPALLKRKWVADVSYELGHDAWRMRGPLRNVTVHFVNPRPDITDAELDRMADVDGP